MSALASSVPSGPARRRGSCTSRPSARRHVAGAARPNVPSFDFDSSSRELPLAAQAREARGRRLEVARHRHEERRRIGRALRPGHREARQVHVRRLEVQARGAPRVERRQGDAPARGHLAAEDARARPVDERLAALEAPRDLHRADAGAPRLARGRPRCRRCRRGRARRRCRPRAPGATTRPPAWLSGATASTAARAKSPFTARSKVRPSARGTRPSTVRTPPAGAGWAPRSALLRGFRPRRRAGSLDRARRQAQAGDVRLLGGALDPEGIGAPLEAPHAAARGEALPGVAQPLRGRAARRRGRPSLAPRASRPAAARP